METTSGKAETDEAYLWCDGNGVKRREEKRYKQFNQN